jgi:hypothetical protein
MSEYTAYPLTYPLTWPVGWPRTDPGHREFGRFKSASGGQYPKEISVSQALGRIYHELKLMGYADYCIIVSTNVPTRNDGLPRSGQKAPDDPGVAVYFRLLEEPVGSGRVIPCDRFTDVAQNLAAVAGTVEALRRLDRYGSGIMERAFTGFEALPNPNAAPASPYHWSSVLDVAVGETVAVVKHQYQTLRSKYHKASDTENFQRVLDAWNQFTEDRDL